jgi:2-C-methyl-D-erythritol 4-phosphate cytidylyltransferase/2-C-methyl-D-erythritol 2,4-cyclodiphosphate synthase
VYVTALIAAGGRGERLGGPRPKQLLEIGGRPILARAVEAFLSHPAVHEVVVALPPELAEAPPPYLTGAAKPIRVVQGGRRRQDSVAKAFGAASERAEVVVVHDGARPFVSAELIARTIQAAAASGAAVAAVRARDTVKRVEAAVAPATLSRILDTLPRDVICLAQTPQAFRREVLAGALAAGGEATDEAALVEQAGHPVLVVEGEATNIKITTPEDLALADAIARARDGAAALRATRIGTGYDLHRLVEGRPLVLGGVTIPFDRGLLGHSDADAVCHAATDALLGAAAAGDIGRHFPDTDPQWRGASSLDLLRRAADLVRAQGYLAVNLDVTVIAERPKLAPFVEAMRTAVAAAIGCERDAVSIKSKTNEGVGPIGRGEAIAVHAVALIHAR